jgi:phage N-6-adenine-methyltransferase
MSLAAVEILPRDYDAIEIGGFYLKGKTSMVNSLRYFVEAGRHLIDKKEMLPHGQWLPWLRANADALGFDTDRTAQRLMAAAKKFSNATLTSDLDDEQARLICREIMGNNVRGTINFHDNEWYTPAKYIELARAVLGEIDLDPASNPKAQEVVRAKEFFTAEQDGLTRPWHGRVWLNPPYAQPLIGQFIEKLVEERAAGNITAAILLTHNYTSSSWFQKAGEIVDAVCFTRTRIAFESANGEKAAPTQGQCFLYYGDDVEAFSTHFLEVGFILVPKT